MDFNEISKIKSIKFPQAQSAPVQKPEAPNKDVSIFAGIKKPQEERGFLA